MGQFVLRHLLLLLATCLALVTGPAAQAQAKLRIVSFTADWCSICQVMDPRMETALRYLSDPSIIYDPVDLSLSRSAHDPDRIFFRANFYRSLEERGIAAIYNGYQGYPYTGYSVILAADTFEPLACIVGARSTEQVISLLQTARNTVERKPAWQRSSPNDNCPSSFNYLRQPRY